MDMGVDNQSAEVEIFCHVQVVIDTTFKIILGDKWDKYLNDIANKCGMELVKEDGKEMFQGEWKGAEKAHELLTTSVYSSIGLQDKDKNFDSDDVDLDKINRDFPVNKTMLNSREQQYSDSVVNAFRSTRPNLFPNTNSRTLESCVNMPNVRSKDDPLHPSEIETVNAYSTSTNSFPDIRTVERNVTIPDVVAKYNPLSPNCVETVNAKDSKPLSDNSKMQDQRAVVFSGEYFMTNIAVVHGNLLKEHVQAIVCPISANSSKSRPTLVSHICDIIGCTQSSLISKLKAPYDIFHMKSKVFDFRIIFILLPEVNTDPNVNLDYLQEIYTKIFMKCESLQLRSLALPSVGSGASEFPVDISANAAWKALENHSQKNKTKKLRLVHFVHIEQMVAIYFKMVFESLSASKENIANFHPTTHNIDNSSDSVKSSQKVKQNEKLDNQCPICLSDIKDCETLRDCKHKFCKDCLAKCFKLRKECPVCRTQYGITIGNQPQGKMIVQNENSTLPGFKNCKTIIIEYRFNSGIQKNEHPNPGQPYWGTTRMAYLPDNDQGRKVLKLLQLCFDRKLTFTIGTSATTGQSNSIIWNGIHHKTSREGGPTNFGYPDPDYLQRVQQELLEKGVK